MFHYCFTLERRSFSVGVLYLQAFQPFRSNPALSALTHRSFSVGEPFK
jgi:hypothetical protein